VRRPVVLCFEKKERGIALQALLDQSGCKAFLTETIYEASNFLAQEMPHVIFSEALLSDGGAAQLADKLAKEPLFRAIPLLVMATKKTREELNTLVDKKLAGVLVGAQTTEVLAQKIKDLLTAQTGGSPYFVPGSQLKSAPEAKLTIEINFAGQRGMHYTLASAAAIPPNGLFTATWREHTESHLFFSGGFSQPVGSNALNLFPVRNVFGPGLRYLQNSGNSESTAGAAQPKILWIDPTGQSMETFGPILNAHGLQAIPSLSLTDALKRLQSAPSEYTTALITNCDQDADLPRIVKSLQSGHPLLSRLTYVASEIADKLGIPWRNRLPKPFGIGTLLEAVDANRIFNLERALGKNSVANSTSGGQLISKLNAQLLGIDETGGVLETNYEMVTGGRCKLACKFFEALFPQEIAIVITDCKSSGTDNWHVRFDAVPAGTSKSKYWERVARELQAQQK